MKHLQKFEKYRKDDNDFDTKLKELLPSLTNTQEMGWYQNNLPSSLRPDFSIENLCSVKDFLDIPYAGFGQEELKDLLIPIIKDLEDGGIDIDDILIGALPTKNWGWDPEDLDEDLTASSLWITTEDKKLMKEIKKKYEPSEFSKIDGVYRFWWD